MNLQTDYLGWFVFVVLAVCRLDDFSCEFEFVLDCVKIALFDELTW